MSELVTLSIENHVADVRLNRPEKHNALSIQMFEAITAMGEELKKNKSVRAVVLSGSGPSFCSGLDVGGAAMNPATMKERMKAVEGSPANFFQKPAYVWKELEVPVIAALHGAVYGGGLQIALGADIRIARPDTKLSVMEVRLGLIPDMAGTVTLRDLIRLDVAKELALTGKIISGTEAAALGMVTRTSDDPLTDAQALAGEMAALSPHAVQGGKKLLEANWRGHLTGALAREAEIQMTLIGSANQMEALQAKILKRPPKFKDPA